MAGAGAVARGCVRMRTYRFLWLVTSDSAHYIVLVREIRICFLPFVLHFFFPALNWVLVWRSGDLGETFLVFLDSV